MSETVILPAHADHPVLPHTLISESGTMTLAGMIRARELYIRV